MRYTRRACFNEAEAHRLGKPDGAHVVGDALLASMRPRLIASENQTPDACLRGEPAASMRPRLIASENDVDGLADQVRHVASMRPRLIASENGIVGQSKSVERMGLQ